MSQEGWVPLERSLLDSPVFQDEALLKVWIWCKLRASHKENWLPMWTGCGKTVIPLKPGQFAFGRKKAAKDLGMSESSVRRRMQKLKKLQFVNIKPDTHFSTVTICNWQKYTHEKNKSEQPKGQPPANHRPGSEQPPNTNNNVYNFDNENKSNNTGQISKDKKTAFIIKNQKIDYGFWLSVVKKCGGDKELAGRIFYRAMAENARDIKAWIIKGMEKDGYAWKACKDEYYNPKGVRQWVETECWHSGPQKVGNILKMALSA